jgi:hypothetical protein
VNLHIKILNPIELNCNLDFTPDWNEKHFDEIDYFFLEKKSDQRKHFFDLEKKARWQNLVVKSGIRYKKNCSIA